MDIKTKAVQHALQMLKASGAQYVVIDEDGNEHKHGDFEVAQKKRKRSTSPFPRGTYTELVKKQGLYEMNIGDVRAFDPTGVSIESLRSTTITCAEKAWGKKSLMTTVRDGKIEAMRIY